MRRITVLGVVALIVATAAGLLAQTPTAPPRFEAASVKPNASGEPNGGLRPVPGRFGATNVTVRDLIRYAYSILPFQLLSAPDWTGTARYDINAVMPDGVRGGDREMVRTLLVERFSLRARRETRLLPVYALVRTRSDALGPQLRPSTETCERVAGAAPRCTMRIQSNLIDATGTDWNGLQLWRQLSGSVDRLIVDKSGLSGRFDLKLQWTPDLAATVATPGTGALSPADNAVSIFTALEEQLGLKLQPEMGPVDVVVVDSVQTPTPD